MIASTSVRSRGADKSSTRKRAVVRDARRILLVAVPPSRALDVYGPVEVFGEANRIRSETSAYQIDIVSSEGETVIRSHTDLPVLANKSYRDVRGPVDTLLVAGGLGARETRCSPEFLDWLRQHCRHARRFGAVCTGSFVLAQAGLLDGKRVTTHWNWCKDLAHSFPRVRVDPEPIFVRDRNCYTSAGATAGIDLALALVEEDLGSRVALEIAQMLVVFLRRPSGQSQFSVTLTAQKTESRTLSDLLAWMPDHLGDDLSVDALARRMAMSPRNFARIFRQEVGTTPARHVDSLRVEAARRLLERGKDTLDRVADRVGLHSAEVLRRAFDRRLNVTPGRYRASFGPPR